MEFKPFHKEFFKAISGAYSRVTEREHYDSQITLTDNEAEIVVDYFGHENIHIGNVNSDHEKSLKRFLLYNNITFQPTTIFLNLVFPKTRKTELRLYLAEKRGYKPKGGDIWFIYINLNHELVIGFLEEKIWNTLGQTDAEDEIYQSEIDDSFKIIKPFDISSEGQINIGSIPGRDVYRRDPRLAINRFFVSDFKCEVDPLHITFKAQKSHLPFMEAHHFIPMKFQNHFSTPLDNLHNIICLCPICHRAMHHAEVEYKYELVNKIYIKRPELHSLTVEDIAQYYNCLKIISN